MSNPEEMHHAPGEGYASRPFVAESTGRSSSTDSRDTFTGKREHAPMFVQTMPSPQNRPTILHHGNRGFPTHYAQPEHRRYPTSHLQSVVTTSFSSAEDERDYHAREQRNDISERQHHYHQQHLDEREGWSRSPVETTPRGPVYFAASTPSPRHHHGHPPTNRPYLQRAYSSPSGGYYTAPPKPPPQDTMRRSYYHHSLPQSQQQNSGHLPPEFMPPAKRSKVASPANRKEVVISPRDGQQKSAEGLNRARTFPTPTSWTPPGRGHYFPPSPHHPQDGSSMPHQGSFQGGRPKPYVHVSPASDDELSPGSWHPSPSPQVRARFWDSPRANQDESDGIMRRASDSGDKMKMMVKAAAAAKDELRASNTNSGSLLLLSLPQDRVALSETLCVVRENIEVFTATQADVDAPAPGRKHAVVVGQVGLRCIHCRDTAKCSDRVKRAVCYPSSIKRIYRTVIDMKLDHFSQCKFVPIALKNRLDELKAVHTRSTGTTMQYFIHAAHQLGMEDGPSGVTLRESACRSPVHREPEPKGPPSPVQTKPEKVQRSDSLSTASMMSTSTTPRIDSMSSGSFDYAGMPVGELSNTKGFEGMISIALPEDKSALSPLRCFLREQVCAFSATEKDIALRAPTTFSISVGQVGIGCIHCVKQDAKLRSNRAVCFPFSIGRIYQSVADIQRFHFGECKNMPTDVKEKFLKLQSASSKGSKGLATRQYWMASAKKIGLVDTPQGIRFGRDPSKPEFSVASLDILAQVAFSVTTASKQLVKPEDKACIADFLYVVMEQLQPCRFTEADRNKRRLKDVGCIGVECKHCAGQVDSRKFFWSSVSAVESNFVSVHTHMLECKSVPQELKDRLVELKKLRKEQTAALRTGSQKAFFARVWQRLHDDEKGESEPAAGDPVQPEEEESQQQQQQQQQNQEEKEQEEQQQQQPPQQPQNQQELSPSHLVSPETKLSELSSSQIVSI